MLVFKRFLYILITFSFLLSSFTYSQSITGAAKKTGGVGLAIQGVKTGKEGLRQLTKYGQELVTQQNNQTEQTSEQQDIQTNEITQQSIKQNIQNQNIQTKQQTQQNSNNILDSLSSSMSNSANELTHTLDKKTKPLQDTANNIGNLFSKIQDSVSSDDNSKEQSIEQEQTTVSSNGKNDKNDNKSGNNGDDNDNINEQTSEKIANGHAFKKHVIEKGEYKELGITTREQFANHIENVISKPSSVRQLGNGRTAYWDENTGTVVITNPKAIDGGTAFRPLNGRAYFYNLR